MTRLKSLELQGYKTFATKAVFDFPGNITAIVGPNGSGKSNIADAIRWVLGEQAYSVLRGKKTEDMIFSGSELKPRAGMAMASITFDNEDGWLPIDFSEVGISRRAYRDGENEYMLNNQRVRLKEINELLAQTGLAERTYTIIGQGLVDAALSLKPDERRRFFEEAAGIGLYRSRREEALNRLEATKRNLERVNDIISELGPRVNSLERQARKVQEYDRIRNDLRLMLRDWYGFQWKKCNDELIQAGTILKDREKNLGQMRNVMLEIEEKYKDFHSEVQGLREKLGSLTKQLAQQHQARESESREYAVLEERDLGLSSKIHDFEIQVTTTSEEVHSVEKSIQVVDHDIETANNEISEVLQERDSAQSILESRVENRAGIEKMIKDLDQKRMQLGTRKMESAIRGEHLLQSVKELEQNLQENRRFLEGNTSAANEIQASITGIEPGIARLQNQIEDASRDIAQLELACQEKQNRTNEYQARFVDIQAQIESWNQKLQVYVNARSQMIGSSEGVKTLLSESEGKKLAHVQGLLHQLIKVPRTLEQAVGAALGEAIDTVIISADANLEIILNDLESTITQKTYVYQEHPVNATGEFRKKSAPAYPSLLEKISFPEHLAGLMIDLLHPYYLVENESDVTDAFKTLPENSICVTKNGKVYFPNGLLVLHGGEKQSGLTYTREIEEIQAKISLLEPELENAKQLAENERKLAGEAEAAISSKREILASLVDESTEHNTKKAALLSQFEQLRQKTTWVEEQNIAIEQKLEKEGAEILSSRQTSEEISNLEKELDVQMIEHRKRLDLLPIQEMTIDLNQKQENLQKADQKKQVLHSQSVERKNQKTILEQRISYLNTQKHNAENEKSQVETEKKRIEVGLGVIREKIRELQGEISPIEEKISAREVENQQFVSNLGNARQSLTIAERYFAQAQLEHARHKDRLDNLRAKIEDDFGLVAFTYAEEVEGPSPLPFEGLVEQLPNLEFIPENLEESILRQKAILRRIGPINQEANREYQESRQRLDFLQEQVEDLRKADEDLRKVISELDILIRTEFHKTFDAVAKEFHAIFGQLFVGGSARLSLSDSEDPNEIGVDIEARLPGRREQGLSLLSGGERSLTATALIFALLRVSPTPLCVLDEVDAMLDESNVGRFCELLVELSKKTQFIVITHNRNTVQVADVIYGVTMGRDSASQVIGLRMDELSEEMVK